MSTDNRLAQLEQRVQRLEDEQAIRKLHHAYGYYIDKCLYNEVVELFAEDSEVRFMRGIFRGKEGARRLYVERFQKNFTSGNNGPVFGFLLDHPQMQDIVNIDANGTIGYGRFRCLMQAGRHVSAGEKRQWWEGGQYENTYVKENGVWKIKVLNYRPVWHATFEDGWAHTKPNYVPFFNEDDLFPKSPIGPDAIDNEPLLWPDTDVVPFHYPHPVTGTPWQK